MSLLRDYTDLFSHARFAALVLQTAFNSGSFFVVASAGATLMIEMLGRPAAEFGLWFALFPLGYLCGTFVSSRVGNRLRAETMILTGTLLATTGVAAFSVFLLTGRVSPATIFIPGFFIPLGQGFSIPYTQSGAMAVIPRLAGTASGIGVFCQFFTGAAFAQLYGIVADGTAAPVVAAIVPCATLTLICGILPVWLRRREASATAQR